jgi:hypothetical protein
MGKRSSPASQPYDANDRKTFKSALCHLLQTEFPSIFEPMITLFFTDKIDEMYDRFHPPRSRFTVGQTLWVGVAANNPPARNRRIEDADLVPVVLDLVTHRDIDETKAMGLRPRTRSTKIVRLFHQAYERGAVLSQADVSLLTDLHRSTVSQIVLKHERDSGEVVPCRGTIHDMGRSITHKAIICYKSLVEHKPTSQVAQETYHTAEAVEYYLQCFRRIQLCRDSGMTKEDIARTTSHSLALVQEYLDLMAEFGLPSLTNYPKGDSGQPKCT